MSWRSSSRRLSERGFRWPIAITAIALLTGLLAIVSCQRDAPSDGAAEAGAAPAAEADEASATGEMLTAELYFPGTGGWLHAERRELPANAEIAERVSTVVETLLAGPRDSGMRPPLPGDVTVRRVYLAEDGLAFLDLQSPEDAPPPASGSLREMLTVYSLVNTVVLNFEELERIVLLWNGRQRRTFAGHLDTMRPLTANTDLIAQAP